MKYETYREYNPNGVATAESAFLAHTKATGNRASILDCGGPPPLFPSAGGAAENSPR
jgi:hypothetical protein